MVLLACSCLHGPHVHGQVGFSLCTTTLWHGFPFLAPSRVFNRLTVGFVGSSVRPVHLEPQTTRVDSSGPSSCSSNDDGGSFCCRPCWPLHPAQPCILQGPYACLPAPLTEVSSLEPLVLRQHLKSQLQSPSSLCQSSRPRPRPCLSWHQVGHYSPHARRTNVKSHDKPN